MNKPEKKELKDILPLYKDKYEMIDGCNKVNLSDAMRTALALESQAIDDYEKFLPCLVDLRKIVFEIGISYLTLKQSYAIAKAIAKRIGKL